MLVKGELAPSWVTVSPCSESPDNDDQTHLNNLDHELHAANWTNTQQELKFALIYIDKMNKLARQEAMIHDGLHSMNISRAFAMLMRDCLGTHPKMLHSFFELDKHHNRWALLSEAK